MSATAVAQPDYDFWEFANCGRCQLPFALPSGATVPFWLTECGHIVCNNHLNADQSCSICGSPGIQLAPLQREMEAPMSEWFQSVPIALDSIANAAKFQHETMAAQIRHHRTRYQQQRALIERLRHDLDELKKLNEQLQDDNNRLRQHMGKSQYPVAKACSDQQVVSNGLNANGKRPPTGAPFYDQVGAHATTSSPHSIATPLGPNRLTLPRGQTFSNGVANIHNPPSTNDSRSPITLPQHRPASSFINKYSYVPPSTPQFHRPQLTHAQITAQNFKRIKPNPEKQEVQFQQHLAQNQAAQSMPPPPTPARFRTARASQSSAQSARHIVTQDQPSSYSDQHRREMADISSQSTRLRQSVPQTGQNDQNSFGNINRSSSGTNRVHPQAQLSTPSTSTGQVLKAPMGNGPQRFFPAGTRAPFRAQQVDPSGGQRVPFLPQN